MGLDKGKVTQLMNSTAGNPAWICPVTPAHCAWLPSGWQLESRGWRQGPNLKEGPAATVPPRVLAPCPPRTERVRQTAVLLTSSLHLAQTCLQDGTSGYLFNETLNEVPGRIHIEDSSTGE